DRPQERAREPACRSPRTSAPSNGDRLPWFQGEDFDIRRVVLQLVGRPLEEREGAVVAGDAALRPQQLERYAGLARVHREVAADRQNGDVRAVDPADQLHVAEDAGVA